MREFSEGVDRICRELEVNGAGNPSFHTDEFILKITVREVTEKVTAKVTENGKKVTEKVEKVTENGEKLPEKVTENYSNVIERVIEKASANGDKLTENRIAILEMMIDNPYISKTELSQAIGISANSIMRNIDYMRGKYLRRVGPDKGGFWEIIKDEEL